MDLNSMSKEELIKLLDAQTKRADEERKRVGEERKRADEERKRAGEERKRADEERKRVGEERKRADEERKRADEERKRADEERKRAGEAEDLSRPTSFEEFLIACHTHISVPVTVQTNNTFTTKGSITSATGRYCPTFLEPWDFHSAQQPLFDEAYIFLHPSNAPELRVFPPRQALEHQGHIACLHPLGSEGDLQRHQFLEVETPIYETIKALAAIPAARERFSLADGIVFENHLNSITEIPMDSETSVIPKTIKPDQNCIFHQVNGERNLIYVTEYKAAHKLTDDFIRSGLYRMNMYEDVVQRAILPDKKDKDGNAQYNAERLTCSALTQTFDYMIRQGLEYSCLTNGRIKVMLRVPIDNPEILQYSILEPSRDAEPVDDQDGFRFPYTAVSCYLGLTLLALASPRRAQAWRNSAQSKLNKWEVNFEKILQDIPVTERKIRPSPAYRPPRYPIDKRSPYLLRNRRRRPIFDADTHNIVNTGPGSPPSDDEADFREPPSSPLQTIERRKRQRISRMDPQSSLSKQPTDSQNRPYCTQRCLRGLISRLPLDPKCPNTELHKYKSKGELPLAIATKGTRSHGNCRYLKKGGIHGSIFALTLKGYGYTCIGKGTSYRSKHEAHIYGLLEPLQGITVPIFLGDVHFTKSKYFLLDRTIVQLSLMAWGGKCLSEASPLIEEHDLADRVKQAQKKLLSHGVAHLDFEERNILWNEEVQGVMVIDFGRVKVIESLKRKADVVLVDMPNARRTMEGGSEKICDGGSFSVRAGQEFFTNSHRG
ncbi:hypothetical protein TEQG_06320 [Trichophyton equinum CBS 127.97]|uniref:Protein kinase domain-containing protein n=1 Tax=Trichophyton equinum (strain ATCC MYA-4606 / CBS 127.97) TaxID=559882 RepID=F2PZC9_TRIEC|nr:hypothetical protein TEQG_06320 [Trichophyton equinum CBS 127.97]